MYYYFVFLISEIITADRLETLGKRFKLTEEQRDVVGKHLGLTPTKAGVFFFSEIRMLKLWFHNTFGHGSSRTEREARRALAVLKEAYEAVGRRDASDYISSWTPLTFSKSVA